MIYLANILIHQILELMNQQKFNKLKYEFFHFPEKLKTEFAILTIFSLQNTKKCEQDQQMWKFCVKKVLSTKFRSGIDWSYQIVLNSLRRGYEFIIGLLRFVSWVLKNFPFLPVMNQDHLFRISSAKTGDIKCCSNSISNVK